MKIGIITIHYSFITRNYGSLMPVSYTHLTLPTT